MIPAIKVLFSSLASWLIILKYVRSALAAGSSIWGVVNVLATTTPERQKQLTPAVAMVRVLTALISGARSSSILYMRVPALVCVLVLSAQFRLQYLLQAQSSPGASQTPDSSRDVLWRLAQQCANDLSSDSGCRAYTKNEKQEYVVIKDNDRAKPQGYLLIPLAQVTGIEDSQVFSAPFLDLWESAWLWSGKYPGKPPSQTGLAINSMIGRTQNQLHLHISCVLPEVARTLARRKIPVSPGRPAALKLGPHQNTYWAVMVLTLEGKNSPFEIVRDMAQVNKTWMKDQGILVTGSRKEHGYYILNTTANGTNLGLAEELLDQTCGRE